MTTGLDSARWLLVASLAVACQRPGPTTVGRTSSCVPSVSPAGSHSGTDDSRKRGAVQCSFSQSNVLIEAIHPELEPSLSIRVRGAAIEAQVTSNTGDLAVKLLHPLAFSGSVPRPDLGIRSGSILRGGMFHAGSAVSFASAEVRGTEVLGRARLGPYSVARIVVGCTDLVLRDEPSLVNPTWPSEASYQARTPELRIYPSPEESGAKDPLVLEPWPIVAGTFERPGWLRVSLAWSDSSKVSGFAKAEDLTPLPQVERGGGIGSGISLCRPECRASPSGAPELVMRIQAGASIWNAPHGVEWARVSSATTARGVFIGSEWAQLTELDQVEEDVACRSMLHAYVRREDVEVTKESHP
jgi:hypothetical protein